LAAKLFVLHRTQQALGETKIGGALFMDVKSAFDNVSRTYQGKRMEAVELEPDLIRWTAIFMTDRPFKLVLDGETGEANPVDTGDTTGFVSSTNPLCHRRARHF
jgi:hypothetical protein